MNIAIITGASSGMGYEYALQLEKNFKDIDEVWLVSRREERLIELSNKINIKSRILALDLLKDETFTTIKNLIENDKATVKLLINCAGCGRFGSTTNTSIEDDMNVIDLNIKASVMLTRICLKYMEKGSYLIEMGSMSSYQPTPYVNTYAATKAFILSYTRGLKNELKNSGIRIMCVTPFWVNTEFFNYAFQTNDNKVINYNKLYSAKEIVEKAYKDLLKTKKDRSVCGFSTKLLILFTKIMPHRLVMKIWNKQQRKAKNLDKIEASKYLK